MDEVSLRNRCHDAVLRALDDEGVLSFDQATSIGRAIMSVVDILLAANVEPSPDDRPDGENFEA
jgi:hypothetical protein